MLSSDLPVIPLPSVAIVAVIVTGVTTFTDKMENLNAAPVAPARTVTVAGTVAASGLLLESATVTSAPPKGGLLSNVTLPMTGRRLATLGWSSVRELTITGGGAKTVSSAVLVTPPKDAEIVTVVETVTGNVVTVAPSVGMNPGKNVTLAGTVAAAGSLLERVTTAGAKGAALRLMPRFARFWREKMLPPTMLVGFTNTDDRLGAGDGGGGAAGPRVSSAVLVTPPKLAERVTDLDAVPPRAT